MICRFWTRGFDRFSRTSFQTAHRRCWAGAAFLSSDVTHGRCSPEGQVAQVQISQEFQNTSHRTIEASFVFPIPQDGAIERLTLMVGDKEYEAKLLPREEAVFTKDIFGEIRSSLNGWDPECSYKCIPDTTRPKTLGDDSIFTAMRQYRGLTEWNLPLRSSVHVQ